MIVSEDIFGNKFDTPNRVFVSNRCSFSIIDEKECYVLIDDRIVYTYDLDDHVMERFVWVNIYEGGYATYKQISDAVGMALRTIKYWVSRARENGKSALFDKPGRGRKRVLSDSDIKHIKLLREARKSYREIARIMGVSHTTVSNVLKSGKADNKAELDLEFTKSDDNQECHKADEKTHPSEDTETSGERKSESEVPVLDDEFEALIAADRSEDRLLAALGKLSDARPLFAPTEHLNFAGVFIAFVIASTDPFMKAGMDILPRFKAAFYGTRTSLVFLLTMALLRIKRPENIKEYNAENLGRLIGLDRMPEIKTIRRKIKALGKPEWTAEFMRETARQRSREYEGSAETVMVDGHVTAYSGKRKVGSTWSPRDNRVTKGQTENWVNLPGKCPLLTFETPFNDGLSKSLEDVISETKKILGAPKLDCVFDRGGYNTELFEKLTNAGYGLITYRKGNYPEVDKENFKKEKTLINGREFDYAPYEKTVELKIYTNISRGENKKPLCRYTKRKITMREIRIIRSDGRQTAILANKNVRMSTFEIAEILFKRIGSQENIFKYMRSEFDIDALAGYSFKPVDSSVEHPNPEFAKLEKKAAKLRSKRNRLLAELGDKINKNEQHKAADILRKFGKTDKAEKLDMLNSEIVEIKTELNDIPVKENAAENGYRKPDPSGKRLMNIIKISAYMIETKLYEMLSGYYNNCEKDGRKLLAAAFRSSGSLKLKNNKIIIRLKPQSTPVRTKALNRLIEQLNKMKAKFPGSHRTIFFEPIS